MSREVFPEDSDNERCPQCGVKAFVDGTYGTEELPGRKYPMGYKLCLNCGYDEWPKMAPSEKVSGADNQQGSRQYFT